MFFGDAAMVSSRCRCRNGCDVGVLSVLACRCRSVNVKAVAGTATMLLAREWCCQRVAGSSWLLLRGVDNERCS